MSKAIRLSLAAFVTALLLAQLPAIGAGESKPNILVILADDLGWGDLGCYPKGAAWGPETYVPTPHIDRLAASGVRCTDGYATCMVCSPSRAALLAGRYQQRFGWYGFVEAHAGIPRDIPLLPQSLRAAGYATGMVGKWHVGLPPGAQPLDRGFERFFGFHGGQHDYFEPNFGDTLVGVPNAPDAYILDQDKPVKQIKYLTDEFTDRALAFMRDSRNAGRPFFLYLAYSTPHPPMQSRWEDLEPYAKQRPHGRFNERDIARAMIVDLDANVGRLTAWLRESGIAGNTLVIFSSDNGGADDGPGRVTQHNGGLRGRKGYFYEGGIRIPYIVNWPGHVPAGTVYRQAVSHLDIYPTALAAAGVPDGKRPAHLDGVDLLPFLAGARSDAPHARLFWSLENRNVKWAVREGRWKLVNDDTVPTFKQLQSQPHFQTQLFDVERDPLEQHDLASAEPDRVASLRRAMTQFHASMKPSLYTPAVDAVVRAITAERKKNPALDSIPRADGAPGHWIGAGSKWRSELEKSRAGGAGKPTAGAPAAVPQIRVERIEQMSNTPSRCSFPDWNKIARGYANLAFDMEAKGEYLPLVWIDKSHTNFPEDAFGMYVVVGDPRGGPNMAGGTYHIASGSMGAVLGATLAGIDMRNYKGRNWVRMCRAYFNRANGRNVFMEHVHQFDALKIGGGYAVDFWADIFPSVLAMELGACYPQEDSLDEPLRVTADKFVEASKNLLATPEKFAWSTFDFLSMKPVRNVIPVERDAAGGFAALLYWAYQRFGDRKYLGASLQCLDYLDSLSDNPVYACMLPYGAYTMVRANAEQGRHYDVSKQVRWAFGGGRVCIEGAHAGKWGDYDISGLIEMQGCQRVYAMETFLWAQCFVPAVRYDPRLARPIGKWMQNAASNARYFYPDYLPKEHQVAPQYAKLTRGVIGTEAITAKSMYGNSRPIPVAETDMWSTRNPDGTPSVRPIASNFSLYGSSYVGVFGGIVRRLAPDDDQRIGIDCLKTDFYAAPAFPTYLLYNPDRENRSVAFDVGPKTVDLYDTVTKRYVCRGVTGSTPLSLAADTAAVLVCVPAGGQETRDGGRLLVNGIVVDYGIQ